MRRVAAILLLALFSFSLMGPTLLASSADSTLPACCRRAGKHHCAAPAGHERSGPSFLSARCPQFPGCSLTASEQTTVLMPARIAVPAPHAGLVLSRARLLAAADPQFDAAHERGPPVLL